MSKRPRRAVTSAFIDTQDSTGGAAQNPAALKAVLSRDDGRRRATYAAPLSNIIPRASDIPL
jgi:hypothetical protein